MSCDGLQDAGDIAAVLLQGRHEFRARGAGEQRVGDDLMTVAQFLDALGQRRFLLLGGSDQVQQPSVTPRQADSTTPSRG